MVVAGEGEEGVGGGDTDEKRGVVVDTCLEEGLEVLRGESVGPLFLVRTDQKVAVAVELDQDAGELSAQVIQMGTEILLDREIAAGGVRGDLLREDVDDPVGFVLRFHPAIK